MQVRVAAGSVHFHKLILKGVGGSQQQAVVEVVGQGGALQMDGCRVEGGRGSAGGAVRVVGGSLIAKHSILSSSQGNGLVILDQGDAVLEGCEIRACGMSGVKVEGERSRLHVRSSTINRNAWPNIWVDGAHACLEEVVCSQSKSTGLLVRCGSATAAHSEASCNGRMGVVATDGSSLKLLHCTSNNNKGYGWRAVVDSSIVAEHSQALGNKFGNAAEWSNATITCQGCDLGMQRVKRQW